MVRRSLSLLALAVAVTLLLVGSSGFTASTLSRQAGLAVAEDDAAYLSYDAGCDGGALAVALTNRFEGTTLRTVVTVAGVEQEARLDSQTTATLRFDSVEPGDAVSVRAVRPGGGLVIEFARTVDTQCSQSTPDGRPNRVSADSTTGYRPARWPHSRLDFAPTIMSSGVSADPALPFRKG